MGLTELLVRGADGVWSGAVFAATFEFRISEVECFLFDMDRMSSVRPLDSVDG